MTKALVTIEGVGNLLEPDLELTTVGRGHVQQIIRREYDPARLWHKTVISAPEFLDVMQRSPMILAQTLRQMEKQNQSPRWPTFSGLKETVLAGFCLVAVAILASAAVPWPVWGAILLVALVMAIRGLW